MYYYMCIDVAATDEAAGEDQLNVESQKQREFEAQRQRQRGAEQNHLAHIVIEQYDETKQLSQVELEAQQQAEFESKMQREIEGKKKERSGKF